MTLFRVLIQDDMKRSAIQDSGVCNVDWLKSNVKKQIEYRNNLSCQKGSK